MAEATYYEPGTLCWVELASPDPEASKAFYSELFGWSHFTVADDRLGDYGMFTLGDEQGQKVAGLVALADDTAQPAWTCQFTVEDIPSTLSAARAAGGKVYMDGMDVAHLGRMALLSDPEGAGFGVWQPYTFAGAEVMGEPGAVCWAEVACQNAERAKQFYGAVFGWEGVSVSPTEVGYTNWKCAGRSIAGMVVMDERWPMQTPLPPHWMPYFEVTDCPLSVTRAEAMGARIWVSPTDLRHGRFSILFDPTGARFAVIDFVR